MKYDFNETLGGITGLFFVNDPSGMNFIKKGRAMSAFRGFELKSVQKSDEAVRFLSKKGELSLETLFRLEGELFCVSHTLKNEGGPVYFKEGDLALEMPLNDRYENSAVCIKERCHAHIFAGEDCSYIRADRMGNSEYSMGVVFTKGRIASYSQEEVGHSNRGFFILNLEPFSLLQGESYELEYSFFAHKGGADFYKRATELFENFLCVHAPEGYTVELGNALRFSVSASKEIHEAKAKLGGEELPIRIEGNEAFVDYVPQTTGEKKVVFAINGVESHATFNVVLPFDELIKNRIEFIVRKQQCLKKASPLYGAYLIYDNEEERQYYDSKFRDHNANRERFGMAIMIAKYLQKNPNAEFRASLELFTRFILREAVEEKTGEVFDGIGKNPEFLRLYNAPWVALYFTEYYKLTNDERWLPLIYKIVSYYYSVGGAKFYPNGIRFYEFATVLKGKIPDADYAQLMKSFDEHIQTIMKNGVIYPPHEVNFEQTIVTPASTLLLDKYQLSGEEKYLREAEKHLSILMKFDGSQPEYRLNKIPIRFWDDYWFGKGFTYGDTFPHYWSVLSGYCFHLYGILTQNAEYERYGRECIENCTCLFKDNGRATCAYVYPKSVNGVKGRFADAFANDQDFALYFLLKICENA